MVMLPSVVTRMFAKPAALTAAESSKVDPADTVPFVEGPVVIVPEVVMPLGADASALPKVTALSMPPCRLSAM